MTTSDLITKINLFEALQSKELQVYNSFLIMLQRHIKILLPNVDKAEVLNEMMLAKKNMIDEITAIEEELSPLRRELSSLSGEVNSLDSTRIEKFKNKDIEIIEVISQISKLEQELTSRIQEKMIEISDRLKEIGDTKKIKKQYGGGILYNKQENKKQTGGSYLDFSG